MSHIDFIRISPSVLLSLRDRAGDDVDGLIVRALAAYDAQIASPPHPDAHSLPMPTSESEADHETPTRNIPEEDETRLSRDENANHSAAPVPDVNEPAEEIAEDAGRVRADVIQASPHDTPLPDDGPVHDDPGMPAIAEDAGSGTADVIESAGVDMISGAPHQDQHDAGVGSDVPVDGVGSAIDEEAADTLPSASSPTAMESVTVPTLDLPAPTGNASAQIDLDDENDAGAVPEADASTQEPEPKDDAVPVAATGDLIVLPPDSDESAFTHTVIESISIDGVPSATTGWNGVIGAIARHISEGVGVDGTPETGAALADLMTTSSVGLRVIAGYETHRGFTPIPGLNISARNLSAGKAWRAVRSLSSALGISLEIVMSWRPDKPGRYPGQRGIIRP